MPESPTSYLDPAPRSGWDGDVSRVPFWVYRDTDLAKVEQARVFEGPVWNFPVRLASTVLPVCNAGNHGLLAYTRHDAPARPRSIVSASRYGSG